MVDLRQVAMDCYQLTLSWSIALLRTLELREEQKCSLLMLEAAVGVVVSAETLTFLFELLSLFPLRRRPQRMTQSLDLLE